MTLNKTCPLGNSTTACEPTSGGLSLALGLGLPLSILLVVVMVLIFTQRSKLRSLWTLDQLKSTEVDTRKPEGSQYTPMVRPLPASDHFPIYENYTDSRYRNRSTNEPGDIYLQCDSQDDAIYSNDPSCSLAILPPEGDDDLYVMPDTFQAQPW